MNKLIKEIDHDLTKINWNKNPIKMKEFLSFLKVHVIQSFDHLGSNNGWTLYKNKDLKLSITGGIVLGTEYLDHIQYGDKLQNGYNNFVNALYITEHLTNEGVSFFIKYYTAAIDKIISDQINIVENLKLKLKKQTDILLELSNDSTNLKSLIIKPE